MDNFTWIHAVFLGLAIILEVLANICLKYSNGFKHRGMGILAIIFVLGAFTALAQSVKGIDLSVAYAIWGGFGILATVAMGAILFNQHLKRKGWLGIIVLIIGMLLLKLA